MSLFKAQRSDWSLSHFPQRTAIAFVSKGEKITILASDGAHLEVDTFSVTEVMLDGTSVKTLEGVQFDTAKFVAQCATGSFGK